MKTAPQPKQAPPTPAKQNNASAFFSPFIQPKLTINQPGDVYEREADANAERILTQHAPIADTTFFKPAPQPLQRKSSGVEDEDELQRKEGSGQEAEAGKSTENYLHTLSGGTPLGDSDRSFFESRMGQDFSGVRIHNDSRANESAKSINAYAYTHGSDIVFGSGAYQPGTGEGRKLIAHELTHVVQQRGSTTSGFVQRAMVPGADLGDNNRSVVSDAATVQGAFSDVSQYLGTSHLTGNYAHIFVITPGGLTVFETASGHQVHFYPGRPTERLLPFGLWMMYASGGMERLYADASGRVHAADSWTFDSLDGFSAERQRVIQQRGSIALEDFVDLTTADLQANHFLPAAVISTNIQAGSGTAESHASSRPTQTPWAAGQVASVQQRFRQPGSSGSTAAGGQSSSATVQRTPDRLVGWARDDGSQFVNVWVGGNNASDGGVSEAVELHEGETTGQLQQRVEQATARARERLTQRAVDEENRVTGGNIPYTDSTYLGG